MIKPDHDIPQNERVISRDDGYVVVEKLVAQDDLEEMDLVQTDPTSHNPEVREEALKTLYRLRAEFRERKEPPSSGLKAIELLIAKYEGRAHLGGVRWGDARGRGGQSQKPPSSRAQVSPQGRGRLT